MEVMARSGKFKALSDAIKIAGLVDALNTEGPFTVLAPTDEAVAQVPKSEFTALLEDKDKLRQAVKYHLLEGTIDSRKMLEMLKSNSKVDFPTLSGHKLTFSQTGIFKKHIQVNSATIIASDIVAKNGIIHAIDSVLFILGPLP